MHRVKRAALIGLTAIGALLLASCEDDTSPRSQESQRQASSYDQLTTGQPAKTMKYSPTRDTINFWIDTWQEPDKLSYVYLQASNGQLVGYYVFKGLPVSYCASLTPTYRWEDIPGDGSNMDTQVPAPAMDGTYYSGQGGLCSTYYGRDATTDSYMEYTVGTGISALIYEQPLPRQDIEPLGFTKIEDLEK